MGMFLLSKGCVNWGQGRAAWVEHVGWKHALFHVCLKPIGEAIGLAGV